MIDDRCAAPVVGRWPWSLDVEAAVADMLAGVPLAGLRLLAADVGAVGERAVFNRAVVANDALRSAAVRLLDSMPATANDDRPLIYDVLRVQDRCPLFLGDHMKRLVLSLDLQHTEHHRIVGESALEKFAVPDEQLWPNVSASTRSAILTYCAGGSGASAVAADVEHAIRQLIDEHDGLPQNIKVLVWSTARRHVQAPATMDGSVPVSRSQTTSASTSPIRLCYSFCAFYVKAHYPEPSAYKEGVALGLLFDACRHTPNAKVVQADLRERAIELQRARGVFEVLLVHDDGTVPEGSRSNYFLIDDNGDVLVSRDEDVLVGCTRRAMLEACAEDNIRVVKRRLNVDDVLSARAVGMTGTSVGVLPVAKVDDHVFASAADPLMQRIMALFALRARR